jgi:hypothetical protein
LRYGIPSAYPDLAVSAAPSAAKLVDFPRSPVLVDDSIGRSSLRRGSELISVATRQRPQSSSHLPRRLSRRGTAAPSAALTLITTTPMATGRAARRTSAHRRRAFSVADRSLASCAVATGPMRVSTGLLAPSRRVGLGKSPGDRGRTFSIGRLGELRNPGKGGWTMFDCPPDLGLPATSTASGSRGPRIGFLASCGRDPLSSPSSARIRPKSALVDAKPLASAVSGCWAVAAAAEHRRQS